LKKKTFEGSREASLLLNFNSISIVKVQTKIKETKKFFEKKKKSIQVDLLSHRYEKRGET
jgi:hypothetical protein